MALDALVGEIREKTEKNASAIRSEGQAGATKILNEAQAKSAAIKTSVEDETNRLASRIVNQEVAAANLVVKRDVLNVQKDLLDEVLKGTATAIADLPEDFHKKAVRELLKRAAKEFKEGVVYCNERDVPAVEDALNNLKTLSGFEFGGVIDIDGGVVAESKNGEFQVDFSYATYLSEVWESGLKEASDILFG